MTFTATPLDGSSSPIPMASAVPTGTNTPLALEGGPAVVTGGNSLTPVSTYVKDGNNLVEGMTTDAAVTGDTAGTLSAKTRGLNKILADVWDSTNHRVKVDGSGVTQPVSGTFWQATQPVSIASMPSTPVTGTFWQSTQPVSLATLPALTAGSALIGGVELVDSGGTNKASISAGGALKVDGSAVTQPVSGTFWQTTQPVSGTVTANQGGTWNITNISGTVSLPSGAATSAKQPAPGTAGTASSDVLSVQGITSMTPLKVDGSGVTQPVSGTFWQATQPVSIATMPSTPVTGTFWQATQPVSGSVSVSNFPGTQPVSGTVTANQGGTWTVQPGNTANTTPWLMQQSDLTTSGTISAAQPTIGTPVSNATVVLSVGQGQSSWKAGLVAGGGGFTSGTTIVADQQVDGNWIATSFKVAGSTVASTVQSVVGPGPIIIAGDCASAAQIRVRCSVLNSTETIVVTLRAGAGPSSVGIIGEVASNVNQLNGTTISTSTGTVDAGTQRVTLATDVKVPVKAASGDFPTGSITDLTTLITQTAAIVQGTGAAAGTSWRMKGDFTEQASLSAGSLNADLVSSTDVSAYAYFSVQVTGTFVGTLTVQGSNDNVTFVSGAVFNAGGASSGQGTTTTTGIFAGPRQYRYLRVRMTAYTSGTATGTLELYTVPPAIWSGTIGQSGTWTVQPGNTQNTTPWLIGGPNTNSTAAANAGTGKAIKASSGALWSVVVTATGTAATNIYDNASAASGTVLLAIPANAPVGTIYNFPGGAPAGNGIFADQVANAPSITVFYR